MTSRRQITPNFHPGQRLRARELSQLTAGLTALQRAGRGFGVTPILELACILDEELDTALTSLEPRKGKARRLKWNTVLEEYVQTGAQIDVFNHSETVDFPIDTFGFARWIDGHWVFVGDCSVMQDRPEPPDLDPLPEPEEEV